MFYKNYRTLETFGVAMQNQNLRRGLGFYPYKPSKEGSRMDYIGSLIGVIKGNIRTLDYSSCGLWNMLYNDNRTLETI